MGRHRSGVFYNSSLKGKEYCAKGLPIVSGVETELDSHPEYEYYYRVPANDDPVNIYEIIKFYDKVYSKNNHQEVADSIRTLTFKMFDMQYAFMPVVEDILGH